MQTVSTKELRTNFQTVLDQVEQGAEFTIIHRSKPRARLTPLQPIAYGNGPKILDFLRDRGKIGYGLKSKVKSPKTNRDKKLNRLLTRYAD